ncbi:MAG: AAA family ATPase [Anaerolineaceae bacterium]|nr:AAA family ATPase [Anaerolineaceae bacterium]
MKLIRLYVKDHLLLHDLALRFDRAGRLDNKESYRLDFLVGVNGSGKSTLLRTLVEIFNSLEAGEGANYRFELEYELENNGQPLIVSVDKRWVPGMESWWVVSTISRQDGTQETLENPVLDRQYLPERIIVYTTGSEEEWENVLNHHYQAINDTPADNEILADQTKRFIHENPGHLEVEDIPVFSGEERKSFLLLRASRLNAITLCGLLRYMSDPISTNLQPLGSILEAVGIEKLTGFSLRFRIYDRLSDKSFYEALMELDPPPTIIHQASDRLLVFDLTMDVGPAIQILEKFNGAFGLFQALDSQLDDDPTNTSSPTLQEVNLFLQRKIAESKEKIETNTHIPGVLLLDWLSDGERAFLGRMALLAMLDMTDSLIILDEPEVHFNDYWKREVVRLLDGMMRGHSNHVLITTHSSILLSDVTEGQITVFVKSPLGITEQRRPGIKTFGADPSEIMMVTFDTEMSSGARSEDTLEEAILNGDRGKVAGLIEMIGP